MADEINSKIVSQGDKIRQMKANKAGKDALKPEIDLLLSLKNDYKNATGKDWKPGGHEEGKEGKKEVEEIAYTGGGLTEEQKKELAASAAKALDIKIRSCGDFIRKLKTEKASKEKILEEVEVLKFLKGLYKEKAGKEWVPEGQEAAKAKENKKPNKEQQATKQSQGEG